MSDMLARALAIKAQSTADGAVLRLDKLSRCFIYKGSVKSQSELPTSSTRGHVYTALDNGNEYLWDGSTWVDISAHLTPGDNIKIQDKVISAIDTTYDNATSTTDGLMSKTDKAGFDSLMAKIPENPTEPGTYTLQLNVTGDDKGNLSYTYCWVK